VAAPREDALARSTVDLILALGVTLAPAAATAACQTTITGRLLASTGYESRGMTPAKYPRIPGRR
jgi:hypothetical protein